MSRNWEESHNRFQTIIKKQDWTPGYGMLQKQKNAKKNKRKQILREIKQERKGR